MANGEWRSTSTLTLGQRTASYDPQPLVSRAAVGMGAALVIAEWDRATRSMWDGLQILKEIIDAGATIRVLDRAYIDLTSPIGRGFMALISAMAEDQRLRIIKRTHEGCAIARENGVKMDPIPAQRRAACRGPPAPGQWRLDSLALRSGACQGSCANSAGDHQCER